MRHVKLGKDQKESVIEEQKERNFKKKGEKKKAENEMLYQLLGRQGAETCFSICLTYRQSKYRAVSP